MKTGARVALGVASGYFLGRTKKMKLALMVAGMAAGRQAGGPGALLRQGKDLLGQSPELASLTGALRGRLVDAGKAAAIAVVTRQVESLTDRVGQRVDSLAGAAPRPKKGSRDEPEPAADEADEYDDEPADEPADEDRDEPAPAGRERDEEEPPRRTRQSGGAAGKAANRAGAPTATLKRAAPSARRTQRAAGGGTAGRKSSEAGRKSNEGGRKRSQPARTRQGGSDG